MDLKRETFVEIDSQYNSGLCLDDYGNEISICKAHADPDNDGAVYLDWVFPQDKDRKPIAKSLPWKIALGKEVKQAAKVLRYLANQLEKNEAPPVAGSAESKKEDVPF